MDTKLFILIKLSKRRYPKDCFSCRNYYSGNSRNTLYSQISKLGNPKTSVIPELDKWINQNKKISPAELQRMIRDLRKNKRYGHALEVFEWMEQQEFFELKTMDRAVHLHLIAKVRGIESAEDYFNNLKEEDKTHKTYGSLLSCYVGSVLTDKALSLTQKMKELGLASNPLTYNNLMCLYTYNRQYEKITDLLSEMKENGISPDTHSYRQCINCYGLRSDLSGVEMVLHEMENQTHIAMDWNTYSMVANYHIKAGSIDKAYLFLRKSEEKIERNNSLCYNVLIKLYADLKDKMEVMRLWKLQEMACKRHTNNDYLVMLDALIQVDEFHEAEALLIQWENSGNCCDFRVPLVLIRGYCYHGLIEHAEIFIKKLAERGKSIIPDFYQIIATGYADSEHMEKSLDFMKKALTLDVINGWKPTPRVIKTLLRWLGNKGDIEEVEEFVTLLRRVMPMDISMFHSLLKATINSGEEVKGLLEKMKNDKIECNEETHKILRLNKTIRNQNLPARTKSCVLGWKIFR